MQTLVKTEAVAPSHPGVLRVLRNGKRVYAESFKAELVRQCLVPGTSVSATAMAHGVNANLLRRWIVLSGARSPSLQPAPSPMLLPVTVQQTCAPVTPALAALPACPPETIEIEIHGARIRLHGGVDAQRLGVVLDALARRA